MIKHMKLELSSLTFVEITGFLIPGMIFSTQRFKREVWFVVQVCRKWRDLSLDDTLWSNLFKERWGIDRATFYDPIDSKSWKDVYIVQDRCDRIGLGLKIIREGNGYFLVHQGEIQRYLGSRREGSQELESYYLEDGYGGQEEEPCSSILDKILFFIGDLEAASTDAKRSRSM